MPNWTTNNLTVRGLSPEEQSEFKKHVLGEDLFDHYFPTPKELTYYVSIVESIKAQREVGQSYPWWSERSEEQREHWLNQFTEQKAVQHLIDKYGVADGYNWNINNWGTKWDIADSYVVSSKPSEFICYFNTAWSPPIGALTEISKRFPNATFDMTYVEESVDFCGANRFENGVDKEFKSADPSTLREEWYAKHHPGLDFDDDYELWYDASDEVLMSYLQSLFDDEPINPEILRVRKEQREYQRAELNKLIAEAAAKVAA